MGVPSTYPSCPDWRDRLWSSPAITNGACLHCQMDAGAETPTLWTAQAGKSKRFIIAHASQFGSGRHICIIQVLSVSYWAGLFSGLISWVWLACQHSHMAPEMSGFSSACTLMHALRFLWAELVGFACILQYKYTERRADCGCEVSTSPRYCPSTQQRTCLSLVTTREEIQEWYSSFLQVFKTLQQTHLACTPAQRIKSNQGSKSALGPL